MPVRSKRPGVVGIGRRFWTFVVVAPGRERTGVWKSVKQGGSMMRVGKRTRGRQRRLGWRWVALAGSVLALSALVAGGAVAAGGGKAPKAPKDKSIEAKVNDLLGQMTLDEKLEQLQLL